MTRIVELLVAVNALAGIAVFLGIRSIIRRRLFRRKPKPVPPAVAHSMEARTGHCRGGNHEQCNGGFETPNGQWITCNCPCHQYHPEVTV
jgi:hypothetical protein